VARRGIGRPNAVGHASTPTIIYYLAHALLIAVGVILARMRGTVWPAIGTSLVATGAAGAVIYLYVSRTEDIRGRLELLAKFGLVNAYERRAAQIRDEYDTRLASARRQVDILGFGLSDFRRDYLAQLPAMAARARVRVLLADPVSANHHESYCNERDREEGQTEGTIALEVNEFVNSYERLRNKPSKSRLEIRFYDSLPLVNIFRIDDEIFWGPYFAGRASGNTTTLLVRRGGIMFDQLSGHFDEVWDRFSRAI
jgi:hypothetical protein